MTPQKIRSVLIIFGIPILVLFIFYFAFAVLSSEDRLYTVMSISFIFFLPFVAGALTVYFSSVKKVQSKAYCLFAPWLPILAFFVLTLFFSLEGLACWIMILPIFLVTSSFGGLYGGYLKNRKAKRTGQLNISFLLLLPLMTSPIESMIKFIPGQYKAYTYIDIHSNANKIWSNVTRVKEIKKEQDKGYLTRSLGFPRPIKAELDYEGVGASREAIFSGGLVFHEKVISYAHQQKMNFSITADPHEIPSTTMDKHVVIGGDYFDVLDGTYELQQLNETTYRLHLYSHFKLTTSFNFYASWWAGLIMKDIQNNILQVIKYRAERE
ncbi:hypothetical protein A3860_30110 [Niastella vici]|uniref:SRPBCC family protein n=1 Tax=Niastella vici TaxID=1703345 RepID=A0A1V9FUF1_9BACT|nr:hypothetical protein [Niastella vici]OQP61950.1 hypothetical protein A3860_30110 [Niastella vici]